jgi:2-desacetyl-2-hydroxyethyl bacteriochlorophyllide A dehydrogenase
MKALQLEKPLEFRFIDIPEPDSPAVGEALVRVHRVGICGTDLSGYLGKMPFFQYPRIPGHELGVEVVAVGPGVTNVKAGDRCSVEPYINCQQCIACRRGHGNCCANLKVLGVMTDGGLRPRFIVPARKLHVSKKLSFEQLALVETLAIGCHAVDRGAPTKEDPILVIGAGPIGLAAIVFAKLTGARSLVMDTNEPRLDFCKRIMGVDVTLTPGETTEATAKKLRDANGGDLPIVVIDATGSNKSMSAAFFYVAPTGRLVYVGITTGEVTFTHPTLHRPEATLRASRNALPPDFARIIALIEEGKIDTKPWVTHRTRFEDLIGEFPSFTRPETGVIKAVVEIG